jgi:hypothetical protein
MSQFSKSIISSFIIFALVFYGLLCIFPKIFGNVAFLLFGWPLLVILFAVIYAIVLKILGCSENLPKIEKYLHRFINTPQKVIILLLITLTGILASSELVIHFASKKTVNLKFPMEKDETLTQEFWTIIPGNYNLQLVFSRNSEQDYELLESNLGEFGCKKKSNEPCGSYASFSIVWEIERNKTIIASGVGSEFSKGGGYLSRTNWSKGLGVTKLPVGKMVLRVKAAKPLDQLKSLNPRIIITGGTGGAKTFQSRLVANIWLLWFIGKMFLKYVVAFLWVVIIAFALFKRYRNN